MDTQVTTDYKALKLRGLSDAAKETASKAADKEIAYYTSTIASIKTAYDLLKDTRLTKFVLEANGLIRRRFRPQIFAGCSSRISPIRRASSTRRAATNSRKIVASFNFSDKGKLDESTMKGVQQRGAILETTNQYLQQTLEVQQGNRMTAFASRSTSSARRQRFPAPTVLSATQHSSRSSRRPITCPPPSPTWMAKQADLVKKYIDVNKLSDPEYVDKLVKRFTALYDTQNSSTHPRPDPYGHRRQSVRIRCLPLPS